MVSIYSEEKRRFGSQYLFSPGFGVVVLWRVECFKLPFSYDL